MSDLSDDQDHASIQTTYCPKHSGLWPHECGCNTPKLPSLRTLAHEAQDLLTMIEDSGGELTPEIEEALQINTEALSLKIDHYGHVLKRLPVILEYWRGQRAEADAVVQGLKLADTRIRERLKNGILESGLTSIQGRDVKFTVSRTKPALVQTGEPIPPDYYIMETQAVLDKDKLRQDLELGVIIPGAELRQGFSLRSSKSRKELT